MRSGIAHRRVRATALLALLLAGGCATAESASSPAPAAPVPKLYEVQRQIEAYIASGQYAAELAPVAAAAQAYMEQRAAAVRRPAIVLDIDETSLSNWAAYRANGWARITNGPCDDLQQGPCGIRAWQATARAPALAPTLALVRRARALGVAVFFISGRPAALQAATEQNLRAQGYEWDGVTILPAGARFASIVDFKAPVRQKIAERGYTILINMGDQDSDLAGGYAERTFKLPNPVYFIP